MTYDDILRTTPADAALAANYDALLDLWDQWEKMHSPSEIELKDWDQRVEKLLRPIERASYMEPTDHSEPSLAVAERFNRLKKLLLSRHGIQAG